MIKIIKLSAFVILGLFLYTQAFSATAPCCKNGVMSTCPHPGYDSQGRELAYDISKCSNFDKICPNGQISVNGQCLSVVLPVCPDGQVLLNGNCIPIVAEEPLCLIGSVYNPVTKQCEFTCPDGTKVTSLTKCPVTAVVNCWDGSTAASLDLCPKKECETGYIQYQTCEKNGTNCGTQERACSNNKWTAWSACKVI